MRKAPAFLLSGTAIMAAAVAGGRFGPTPAQPRTMVWYARLRKPGFTPPGPVFGAAWTVLDGLLWYSGFRLLQQRRSPPRTMAVGFWGLTVLGVGGFSYVLFGRKRTGEALGVSLAMAATSAGLAATAASVDKRAALASAPLSLWVIFASVLQEEVWRRN